ncbi:hypothetical protein H5089_00090 [Pseudoalteromonas sp. SR45-1]|uniref:hypothetical protein n=1 Tax=Pseudoalteromonas sp. SR45-1 TaxID=2760932 RepID=UPI001603F621|nr:hypothetical protein [Pseudoalteromonas sp. SR45-1]MBB1323923.1 hypothetical protein [Pseudoalteromonas sp. SR45-1]
MTHIKLMPDYGCYPLWYYNDDTVGCIDPASISLSEKLVTDLNEWQYEFDSTLNHDDPAKSGFLSNKLESDFVSKGYLLAVELQNELINTRVIYFDITRLCEQNV